MIIFDCCFLKLIPSSYWSTLHCKYILIDMLLIMQSSLYLLNNGECLVYTEF